MGLSSFNRMRRERLPVEKLEAERFERDNKSRHEARRMRDKMNNPATEQTALLEKIQKEEMKAMERIGEKVVAGMEGDIPDLPLRKDHAAEIVGRAVVLEDPQGVPKKPTELVELRVAGAGSASEKLAEYTSVDQPGAPPALIEQARQEQLAPEDREREARAAEKAEARETASQSTEKSTTEPKNDGLAKSSDGGPKVDKTDASGETDKTSSAGEKSESPAQKTQAEKDDEAKAARDAVEKTLPAAGPDKSGATSSAAPAAAKTTTAAKK